ncbi:MAG: VOC family protein [Woeseiaceae bacterium]|nr:VOC family protein [Woeseiaceae bacterium]
MLQIIGSSAATAAVMGALMTPGANIASLVIFLVMLAFCLFTLFAGLWLWNGELRGYRRIAIALALQIPILQSSIMSYKFSFGIGMTLYLAGRPGKLHYDLGGFGQMAFFSGEKPVLVGINLVAIAALAWILRRQHQLETREFKERLASDSSERAPTRKAGPARSGALIYASNVETMARFYEHCFGLTVARKAADRVILSGDDLQLVIHKRPELEGQPVDPNTMPPSSIKLFFSVDSIDAVQSLIEQQGGQVLPQRWSGPLFDTINVLDPEGNMQHVREFHAPVSGDADSSLGN